MKYKSVIGMEIHVELSTNSKMFCGCSADWFGKDPNSLCCPVCLGLPGALPVPNRKAINFCIMLGLALNCKIPKTSKFDRKNYFYPDLPKGYQISQFDQPFAVDGFLNIREEGEQKKIGIRRVHMEEDTGKLIHKRINGKMHTLIDFNRSGVPLVEIVTEPDIRSSKEAKIFLKKLHQIIRYLKISDADMEKGSMRLEPNISLSNSEYLPEYKVEVKNINSFNFVKKAIDYEIKRQSKILQGGQTPKQETRGWNEKNNKTYSQRSKEEAHDYRYFPEPDIPPIEWRQADIEKIRSKIPILPDKKQERFMSNYGLNDYTSNIITETSEKADYFENTMKIIKAKKYDRITGKIVANWIVNKKVYPNISEKKLIERINKNIKQPKIKQDELLITVKEVIKHNKKVILQIKKGKKQAIMFLVGLVMQKTKGKADPQKTKALLKKLIEEKN